MRRLVVAALLLLSLATAPGVPNSVPEFACASEPDIYANGIRFISGVCCKQNGELCGDHDGTIPTTCTASPCARTVRRVASACKEFFASSGFYKGVASMVTGLQQKCPALDPDQADNVVGIHAGSTAENLGWIGDACGRTFHGGQVSPSDAEKATRTSIVLSSTGGNVQIGFEQLWLAPESWIKIYDGLESDSQLLVTLTGSHMPSALYYPSVKFPLRSSEQTLTVVVGHSPLFPKGHHQKGMSEGWSFNVTCACDPRTDEGWKQTECGHHGRCEALEPLTHRFSSHCVCDPGYVDTLKYGCTGGTPDPSDPIVPACQACADGYSCLYNTPLPALAAHVCWPDAVHFGPSKGALLNSDINGGYIGLYERTTSACAEAPVYSLENAYTDRAGTKHPAFLYQKLGLWEGYWAIGLGKLNAAGTGDEVDCAGQSISFDSRSCPLDSSPGHPFEQQPREATAVADNADNTPCLDHWRECSVSVSVGACDSDDGDELPGPAQWRKNVMLSMAALVPPAAEDPSPPVWPNRMVLGGEVKFEYNAGLTGEYSRTDTICGGAPVYVRHDAWHKPDTAATAEVKTMYPAYFFRRNVMCAMLPSLLQKLDHCNDKLDDNSVWVVAHENPDSTEGPFDCESISYANAISAPGDCAANPFSVGCDGHWRECMEGPDCPVFGES